MIKEALQYLVQLGNTQFTEVGSQTFASAPVHLIKEPTVDSIGVQSLSGLVEYIRSKFDGLPVVDDRLLVHVIDPTTVEVSSQLNTGAERNLFIKANANLPEFHFDRFYDAETFNIKLQSAFDNDPETDRAVVLQVVGNIEDRSVQNTSDDGVAQTVTARVGVATVAKAEVPNPVVLKPYRTFTEVEQPSSDFVLRLQDGPKCALFEADGGAWELEAMRNVQNYITDHLQELVDDGSVVVIA
jgi:hypothetical protein